MPIAPNTATIASNFVVLGTASFKIDSRQG